MMEKPQKHFKDTIDNSTNPFVPKLDHKPNGKYPLDLSAPLEHPYWREIDEESKDISLAQMSPSEFVKSSLEQTTFSFVDSFSDFMELVNKLAAENVMAVDLETNNERSYQGFTCLMQISIPHFDFIIDTIALREHMHHLGRQFSSPNMIVVLHGDDDTLWLQRDFGLYPRNVFNTLCAARILGLDPSYHDCVRHYFNVMLCKDDQRADWRIRPISTKMQEYARLDSHYLLRLYSLMKNDLIAKSQYNIKPEKYGTFNNLLYDAIAASTQSNLRVYKKKSVLGNPLTDHNFKIGIDKYFKDGRMRDKETDAIMVALFRWRDKTARELDEGVSYIMMKNVIFKIAHSKASTPEEIAQIYDPAPEIVGKLNEISAIIKSALLTADPGNNNQRAPIQEPIPLSPPAWGKNKRKVPDVSTSLPVAKSRNVTNISEDVFGINKEEVANYVALAKEAPKFLTEIYQAHCRKPLDYVVKTDTGQTHVKLLLSETFLSSSERAQETEIFRKIEVYGSPKNITKQNTALLACVTLSSVLGYDPSTAKTSPEFKLYWEKIEKCNHAALVKYLNAKGFTQTSQDDEIRPTQGHKSEKTFRSDHHLLSPTKHEHNSEKKSRSDYNLICRNCEADLCSSKLLFAGLGVHSYDQNALKNVVLRDHPENESRPDKIHKLHCRVCDHSVGNIMVEDTNKRIFNFKKIDVLFREVDSPHKNIEPYKWLAQMRKNKRPLTSTEIESNKRIRGSSEGNPDAELQNSEGVSQNFADFTEKPRFNLQKSGKISQNSADNLQNRNLTEKPPRATHAAESGKEIDKEKSPKKLEQEDSYVAEWLVYKLGLDCIPRPYVHLDGRSFSDFLIFTTSQLITKPFTVSKKGKSFSTKCSPGLFQNLNLTEPQFKELVEISVGFTKTLPNLKLHDLLPTRFYVVPFLTPFVDPDFSAYFAYLSSVLTAEPALKVMRASLPNEYYPSLSFKHISKYSQGLPLVEEKDIAAKEAMEEITKKFERRLLITPGITHRIVMSVDFSKNPNSLNFQKIKFIDYYESKNTKIGDHNQPILVTHSEPVLFNSIFRTTAISSAETINNTEGEYIPELTSLSGITVEMYYAGLLLQQALENLKKSADQLRDLQKFQRTLGYEIRDSNLLKKVFTSRSAADSDRQEDSDYEKEEFLGDAVLELVVSHYLFSKRDWNGEGYLSDERIRLVSNENLSRVAERLGFRKHIIVSTKRVEKRQMSDVMEAFIAGLFLDGGLKLAAEFIAKYIIKDEAFDFFALPPTPSKSVIIPNGQQKDALAHLQNAIEYSFKSQPLLIQALTHKSVMGDNDYPEISMLSTYERLEFLGDSIFKFIASVHIFSKHNNEEVGQMDKLRQGLVSGKSQIKMAQQIGIPQALFLGTQKKMVLEGGNMEGIEDSNSDSESEGDSDSDSDVVADSELEMAEASDMEPETKTEAKNKKWGKKKNPIGDAMEAIVAAVYLETGIDPHFDKCCRNENSGKISELLHFLFSLL